MTPIGTNPVGPVGWRRGALVLSAALTLTSCGMLGGPDSGEKVAKKFVGALGGADVAAAAALTDDPDGASDVLRRTFDGLGEETDADFTVEHADDTAFTYRSDWDFGGAGRGAIRRRCHSPPPTGPGASTGPPRWSTNDSAATRRCSTRRSPTPGRCWTPTAWR